MRRIVVAALAAFLLLPLAPRVQAAVPCVRCIFLGSDSGSGIKDPGSMQFESKVTAENH